MCHMFKYMYAFLGMKYLHNDSVSAWMIHEHDWQLVPLLTAHVTHAMLNIILRFHKWATITRALNYKQHRSYVLI